MNPEVHVLYHASDPESLETGTLTERTIEVAFPTWTVHRWRTKSIPKNLIPKAELFATGPEEPFWRYHPRYIREMVTKAEGPIIFVDGDNMFYEPLEKILLTYRDDNTLLAGQFIGGKVLNNVQQMDRIHTNMMLVDAPRLRKRLAQMMSNAPPFFPVQLFGPQYIPAGVGVARRYDTCSVLYNALNRQEAVYYNPTFLTMYSHLQTGSSQQLVRRFYSESDWLEYQKVRQTALYRPDELRNLNVNRPYITT